MSLIKKGLVRFVLRSSVSKDFRGYVSNAGLGYIISIINRHQHYFAQHYSMYHVVTYGSES